MATENDWVFLREALPDLRDYVLSSDVYRPLRPASRSASSAVAPQLTIGNLLLSQARLSAMSLNDGQQSELKQISEKIHQVREEWRTNWGLKAGREFGSRLNLWQQYVRDLRGDVRQYASSYPSQVRLRTILRMLRPEIMEGVPANEEEQLAMLDQILRGLTQPGPFVWEPEISEAFPKEGFWFLYVQFGMK